MLFFFFLKKNPKFLQIFAAYCPFVFTKPSLIMRLFVRNQNTVIKTAMPINVEWIRNFGTAFFGIVQAAAQYPFAFYPHLLYLGWCVHLNKIILKTPVNDFWWSIVSEYKLVEFSVKVRRKYGESDFKASRKLKFSKFVLSNNLPINVFIEPLICW